jgi:Tripartite tricarboxylate transporter TctB family
MMSPDDAPVDVPGAGPAPDDVDIFGRTPSERGRQLVTVCVALVVACLLVPLLGFLGSFFLLSLFISTVVERRNWIPSLIVSFLAVAAVYGLFVGFLGVPLPTGLIGIGG